jgi:hypothetical protein
MKKTLPIALFFIATNVLADDTLGVGPVWEYCSKTCDPRIDNMCTPCPTSRLRERAFNEAYFHILLPQKDDIYKPTDSEIKYAQDKVLLNQAIEIRENNTAKDLIKFWGAQDEYAWLKPDQSWYRSGGDKDYQEFSNAFDEKFKLEKNTLPNSAYNAVKRERYQEYRYYNTTKKDKISVSQAIKIIAID